MPITAKETKEIFLKALDHESGRARESYLRESCGTDEQLLDQVRALLNAHEDEDERFDFLNSSRHSSNAHVFPLSTLNRERETEDIGTFGDYELLEVIGRGAMGVVYRANQLSLNREVAVKMIRGSFLSTEADVARFRQEAEAAANLRHPNIVPIYEIREIDDVVFFSMELLGGGSMGDRMKELRRHPRRAVEKLALIARAMHIAHINGIIHRDVKPSNILLDDEGTPYLTDFGLAKNTASELGHTLSGHLIGTPSYMAPEQASQGKALTTLADIYSLGAILYEVLTGKPPFTGESLMQVLDQLRTSTPVAPSRVEPRVDRDLETIAMKCLERNPENRYGSASRLAGELECWLRGEPIEARPVSHLARAGRWMRRQPVLAGLTGLVAALVLTLAIGGPLSALREHQLMQDALQSEAGTQQARDQLRRELYASEMRLGFQVAEQAEAIPQLKTLLDHWEPLPGSSSPDLRGWEWDYLRGLTRREIFTSSPMEQRKAVPSWRPDSDQLLIRYEYGSGKAGLWNWKSGQLEREFEAPRGALQWDAAGRARVSSNDGAQSLWDLSESSIQALHPGPSFPEPIRANRGRWSSDQGFLALLKGQKIRIWSQSQQEFLKPLDLPGDTHDFQWEPGGHRLAISGLYQGCFIWDSANGELAELEKPHSYGSHGPLAWHPQHPWLAVGILNNATIRIWDLDANALLHELPAPGGAQSLAWSPQGDQLAVGGGDGVARVWDRDSSRTIAVFPSTEKRQDTITSLAWSTNGERLAAGYSTGRVQAWSLARERRRSLPVVSRARLAVWHPNSRSIVSTGLGRDAGLHHLDLETGNLLELEGAPPWILSLSWNPATLQILASTLSRDHLLLFELDGPEGFRNAIPLEFRQQASNEFPRSLFDSSGSRLALIRPETIEIKAFPDGKFVEIPVDRHTWEGRWSPDGRFLFSLGAGGFCLIDATTFALVDSVAWNGGAGRADWSPDGDHLAIPHGIEPKIGIWSRKTRSWVTEVIGHSGRVACVAWSPDGRRLASAEGPNILLWDTETWTLLGVLRKHRQIITDLSWSPDGGSLLSLGKDQLLLWELD